MSACQIDKDTNVFPPRQVWPLSSVMPPLAPLPTAPACARAFVSITLSLWDMDHLAEAADLVASELVTNAVRASSPYYRDARIDVIRVCLFADRTQILIEVWDEAAGVPRLRAPGGLEEDGRGLTLVDAIASRWGWRPATGRPGKCVWAQLSRLTVAASNALLPPGRHASMAYYSRNIHQSVPGPNSRLAGTGQAADDLYLIAHHEVTGKPYLPPRALGAGLAGGLLAELMDSGGTPAIALHHGYIVPVRAASGAPAARYARINEPVRRHVLELITAEPEPRPARDWLLFLGQTTAAEVAGRLEHSGYLTRPASRIPGRARRPVPQDRDWAHCALLRAHAALNAARTPVPYTALLAGLTLACGLGFRLASLTDAPARSPDEAIRMLSPPLRELIAHVQATADSTLLSHRR